MNCAKLDNSNNKEEEIKFIKKLWNSKTSLIIYNNSKHSLCLLINNTINLEMEIQINI